MTFSTIAILALETTALKPRYRRKVSLKRSAQRSNFSGEIEAGFLSSSALCFDAFGDAGRLRNRDSSVCRPSIWNRIASQISFFRPDCFGILSRLLFAAPLARDHTYNHFFHLKNR